MRLEKVGKTYTLHEMNIDEFTALILALGDYSEKRGTDTTGYNMLYSLINIAEQAGNKALASAMRSALPISEE